MSAPVFSEVSRLLSGIDCTIKVCIRKLSGIDEWLTLAANIGVPAGILSLALEIQQNFELMRIQIQQNRAESAMSSLGEEYNSPSIPAIRVKVDNGEPLTQEEERRYREWFRASNRNQENILYQHNAGILTENSPRTVERFIEEVAASSPQSREAREDVKRGFTQEYVSLEDSTLQPQQQEISPVYRMQNRLSA